MPRKDLERPVKENYLHRPPLSISHILAVWGLMLTTLVGVIIVESLLPTPLNVSDEKDTPGRFIAERSMKHLKRLTDIGPRVCGSHENEVLSVELLTSIVKGIQQKASSKRRVELDVAKWSGSFPLQFLDNMVNVYRNVQGVVVKVSSNPGTESALLLNCHYDTVPDSPGASDDGAGCAVLLEVLEQLAKSDAELKHNIIFLFNGAEENILQASHGFITHHKWAKEVKAFINLEACGAGGREVLFQAGPHSPFLVEVRFARMEGNYVTQNVDLQKTYARVVPYPYASSLAQEIFESGIIPGDTDFRIFRDFGNVSGLDFAWSANGYVYHTELDTVERIPLGSLQRTGDNILALTTALSEGDELSKSGERTGQPVYFDLLGAFVVIATGWKILFLSLVAPMALYMQIKVIAGASNTTVSRALKDVCTAIAFGAAGLVAALLAATFAAIVAPRLVWYARPSLVLPLFAAPAIAAAGATLLVVTTAERRVVSNAGWSLCMRYSTALNAFWVLILVAAFCCRARSGFVCWLWATLPSLLIIQPANGPVRLLWLIAVNAIPFVQSVYLSLGFVKMFIPVLGRSGAALNANLACALLITVLAFLSVSCALPLLLATHKPWVFVKILLAVWLSALLFSWVQRFPYRPYTSPQRFMLLHTLRTIHYEGDKTSYGYWSPNMDSLSPHTLDDYVSGVREAHEITQTECEDRLYCGAPYYLPVMSFISRTHYIPSLAPPKLPFNTKLEVAVNSLRNDLKRFSFNITGPHHVGVMLSPISGGRVIRWSLTDGPPLKSASWGDRDTHFVYFSDATQPDALSVYTVNFDVLLPPNHRSSDHTIDVSVAGHHLFGPNKADEQFRSFVKSMPEWTTTSYWSCDLHMYRF